MAKVAINIATPFGYMVAEAINQLQISASKIARAEAAAAMITGAAAPNNTLDASSEIGGAQFGGALGSTADYAYALNVLNTNLQAFLAANSGSISTLDQGIVA